jgi:branched-chain amino acid aminotransferase
VFIRGEAVEEAGASNFFAVFDDNTIVTPSLQQETILPGVTRASILELAAAELGLEPCERKLTLEELRRAKEAFCCGTGACITPVGSVNVAEKSGAESADEIVFGDGDTPGPITEKLYHILTGIQTGSDKELAEKYKRWIHIVEPSNKVEA